MPRYTVAYQLATYEGERTVFAEDEEQALARVRKSVRASTSLTMYYEHYRVVRTEADDDERAEP